MKLFAKLIQDLFVIIFITYLVYLILELLLPGIISNYFDLNILLVSAIVLGFLMVLVKPRNVV